MNDMVNVNDENMNSDKRRMRRKRYESSHKPVWLKIEQWDKLQKIAEDERLSIGDAAAVVIDAYWNKHLERQGIMGGSKTTVEAIQKQTPEEPQPSEEQGYQTFIIKEEILDEDVTENGNNEQLSEELEMPEDSEKEIDSGLANEDKLEDGWKEDKEAQLKHEDPQPAGLEANHADSAQKEDIDDGHSKVDGGEEYSHSSDEADYETLKFCIKEEPLDSEHTEELEYSATVGIMPHSLCEEDQSEVGITREPQVTMVEEHDLVHDTGDDDVDMQGVESSEKDHQRPHSKSEAKHPMLPPCSHRNCNSTMSSKEREAVHENFWSQTYNSRRLWILNNVTQSNKRSCSNKKKASRRKNTLTWHISGRTVCKKYFLSTIGFRSDTVVRVTLNHQREGNFANTDQRGKHPPANKFSQEYVALIQNFIETFSPEVSHCKLNHSPNRRYLPLSLSIRKLYRMFIDTCKDTEKCSYTFFHKVFSKMNISFAIPSCDLCLLCEHHQRNHPDEDHDCTLCDCEDCQSNKAHR